MSYTRLEAPRLEAQDERQAPRLPLASIGRTAGLGAWAVANVAILFAELLAELLAPFLLLAGAVWWVIPRGLDAVRLEGPANDILQQVRAHVPLEVFVNGNTYTPHTLIADGLLCIAAVAVCRTLSSLLASLLLDRS